MSQRLSPSTLTLKAERSDLGVFGSEVDALSLQAGRVDLGSWAAVMVSVHDDAPSRVEAGSDGADTVANIDTVSWKRVLDSFAWAAAEKVY
jgi:hypothetical protein